MFLAVMLDRPARGAAQCGAGRAGDPGRVAREPVRSGLPDVVCGGGGAGLGLRVAARARRGARRRVTHARGAARTALLFFGGIVASTLIASFAVAPFGIYHFHNTQQFAILANLVAIPICNIVVMPAALATLVAMPFGLEAAPLWVMGWGIEAMVWCADWVAGLPGAVGRVPAIPTYRVRADGRRRAVVRAVEHALAAAGRRAHRAGPHAGADGPPSGRADRARRRAGRGAHGRRRAVGARRPRLQLRAGALARA